MDRDKVLKEIAIIILDNVYASRMGSDGPELEGEDSAATKILSLLDKELTVECPECKGKVKCPTCGEIYGTRNIDPFSCERVVAFECEYCGTNIQFCPLCHDGRVNKVKMLREALREIIKEGPTYFSTKLYEVQLIKSECEGCKKKSDIAKAALDAGGE